MASSDADQIAAEAVRKEQLGLFSEAIQRYRHVLETEPNHVQAAVGLFRLLRDLRKDRPKQLTLVWQIAPSAQWEGDWLHFLLAGLDYTEVVDGEYRELRDGSIVIDNRLNSAKAQYYSRCSRAVIASFSFICQTRDMPTIA